MVALLAMVLQELMSFGKKVGSEESKTRMQSVGSMLCQLSIVVHCCPLLSIVSPGSMLSPLLGLQARNVF